MTYGLTNKKITRGFRTPFQNPFEKYEYTFKDHRTNNGVSGCQTMQIISYRIRIGESTLIIVQRKMKRIETLI